MGSKQPVSSQEFTLSGTGSGVVEFDFCPATISTAEPAKHVRRTGRVLRFYVREELGGGATAATFYLFNRMQRLVTSPSTAAHDKMVMHTSSVPLTASATTESLDTVLDARPVFKDSLTLVADVTASGAWSLVGYLEISEGTS